MRYSVKSLLVLAALFGLSLTAAWVLYGQLQSVAEGTWAGFKLGGAVAVFVVVFLLLRTTYERTLGKSVVKVQISFADGGSPPDGGIPPEFSNGKCTYSLYNRDTLEQLDDQAATLLKEGAGLVFYVESESAHDLIRVDLTTSSGVRWQSAYHGLHVTPVQMERNGSQD